MKDVVIVANFCGEFTSINNGRFKYLADMLSDECEVEVVTSDFSHGKKQPKDDFSVDGDYKATFIHEPGYPKNICVKRFRSHYVFGRNVRKYLEKRKTPDVIYCATPSLDVAYQAAKYAKKHNVKFIIDVQDIWPEAFKMVFDLPPVSSIIYSTMTRKANKAYAIADEVIAVSETYANRAIKANKKCKKPTIAFLGTELAKFDEHKDVEPILKKAENEVFMAYIGTLGNSYDLISVMDAMILLRSENKIPNLKFVVMGRGDLKDKFETYAKENNLPVDFLGKLPYFQMVSQLCACDFAVNPIKAKSAGSIINKVGDYAAAGIAVINTQNCAEYRNLLDGYGAGINCENGNIEDMAKAIERLYNDKELRQKMGQANRRLAEDKFDREKTYKEICELIVR